METTVAQRAGPTSTDGGLRGTLRRIVDGCSDAQLEEIIKQARGLYGNRSELGERAAAEPDDLSA